MLSHLGEFFLLFSLEPEILEDPGGGGDAPRLARRQKCSQLSLSSRPAVISDQPRLDPPARQLTVLLIEFGDRKLHHSPDDRLGEPEVVAKIFGLGDVLVSELGERVGLLFDILTAQLGEPSPVHPELVSQGGQVRLLPPLQPQVLQHSQAGLDPGSTPALFGVLETRSMT